MKRQGTDLRPGRPQGVADDMSSAWEDDGNDRVIPIIPGPRPSDDAPRIPQQPQRDLSVAVAA